LKVWPARIIGRIAAALLAASLLVQGAAASPPPAPVATAPSPLPVATPSASAQVRADEAKAAAIALTAAQQRQARWDEKAAEAIRLLEARPRTSSATVIGDWEKLRADLARQRDEALAVSLRGTLPEKIARGQLGALGPPPTGEATEDAQKAARRVVLEEQLTKARGPSIAAEDSYARAVVLIREIDTIINAANHAKLFERGPSPLLPSSWAALVHDLNANSVNVRSELQGSARISAIDGVSTGAVLIVVLILALCLAASVLIQRRIMRSLDRRIAGQGNPGVAIILTILRDVVVLLIPLVGLFVLMAVGAVVQRSAPGLSLGLISISLAGLFLVFGLWLGHSLFSPGTPSQRFIPMANDKARQAHRVIVGLSTIMAAESILENFEQQFRLSPAASGVLPFILVTAAAFLLHRLTSLLASHRASVPAGEEVGSALRTTAPGQTRIDYAGIIAQALNVIAVALIAIAVLGYNTLARDVMTATFMTLAIIALAMLSFRRTVAIARAFGGRFAEAHQHVTQLAPVALGLLLILVAIPLILMAWGVRAAQLSDVISAIRNGVDFGGVRISVGDAVTFVLVFMLGYAITRWVQRIVQVSVLPRLNMDAGAQSALLTAIGYVGLVLAALIAITSAGLDLSNLAIVAGALGVGIGFGLQSVVANFVSGIILLVERPIREGDLIVVGDHTGTVVRISVRSTRIRTFERDDVIIPNSDLITGTVRNRTYSGTLARIDLAVGIAYGSDVAGTEAIVMTVVRSNSKVLEDPAPLVLLDSLGDSALNIRVLCYIDDLADTLSVKSEILAGIYRELDAAGIKIPFPQREVTVRTLPA